jgi:Fe-S cluster biogenesis protein NfuA
MKAGRRPCDRRPIRDATEGSPSVIENKVKVLIERIRPSFQIDGHDLEVVEITVDNIVRISLCGHCNGGCAGSKILMGLEVERALKKRIPEVAGVEVVSRPRCVETEAEPSA